MKSSVPLFAFVGILLVSGCSLLKKPEPAPVLEQKVDDKNSLDNIVTTTGDSLDEKETASKAI